jgi:hypothetical protein
MPRTLHINRDGITEADGTGGIVGNDSLTTWSLAARDGDPTKPFASIAAAKANAGNGDTLILHATLPGRNEYTQPDVTAAAAYTSLVTLKGYPGTRPVVQGFRFHGDTLFQIENVRATDTMRLYSANNVKVVNVIGRNRTSGSTTSGNFYVDVISNCTFDRLDISYAGPYTGLTGTVNNFIVAGGGHDNTFTRCRFDGSAGDAWNGPGDASGQDNWIFDGCEFSRVTDVVLNAGTPQEKQDHGDAIEFVCGGDNFTLKNTILHTGVGRVFLGPQQANNSSTSLGGQTNAKIINNVWVGTTDFCLRCDNCPGIFIAHNTITSGKGLQLITFQGTEGNGGVATPTNKWTRGVILANNYIVTATFNANSDPDKTAMFNVAASGGNMYPSATAVTGSANYSGVAAKDRPYGTPTFVDPTADPSTGRKPNMRLVAGSRGINEGITGTGVTLDADGATRSGTPDVGAYEFGGTTGGGGGTGGGTTTGEAGPALATTANVLPSPAGADWTGTGSLLDEAGGHSTISTVVAGGDSKIILAGGFSLPNPAGATLPTLTTSYRRKQGAAGVHLKTYQIYSGGALRGTNMATGAVAGTWASAYEIVTVTGTYSDWGAASAAQLAGWVNATDFAIAVQVTNSSGAASNASVDWLKAGDTWGTTTAVPESPPVAALSVKVGGVDTDAALTTDAVTFDGTGSSGATSLYELALDGSTFQSLDAGTLTTTLAAGTYPVVLRVTGPGGTSTDIHPLTVTAPDSGGGSGDGGGTGGGTGGDVGALSFAGLDSIVYEPPAITVDRDAIVAAVITDWQAKVPGLQVRYGSPEWALVDTVVSRLYVELLELLAERAEGMFRFYGEKLVHEPLFQDTYASTTITVANVTSVDQLLQAGTQFTFSDGLGDRVAFATGLDVPVPANGTATVTITAVVPGAAGTGLSLDLQPERSLAWFGAITATSETMGGSDGEDQAAYVSRLAQLLTLLGRTLTTQARFETFARSQQGVGRALAIDFYDATTNDADADGHITVAVAAANGHPIGDLVRAAIEKTMQDLAVSNLAVHVIDPTYTPINIAWTGVAMPGFDPIDVRARVNQAVLDSISPANWGRPQFGDQKTWLDKPTVRYQDISAVINNVTGLDHWDTLTINGQQGTDFTMPGPAALPAFESTVVGSVSAA